jgi:hypothetical protein
MNQSAWSPTFRGAARQCVGRCGPFQVAAGRASIMGGPELKPAWSISRHVSPQLGPGLLTLLSPRRCACAAVMTVNRIIVISGFCIIALGAALAGDYAAVSVSVAAALAQAVGV